MLLDCKWQCFFIFSSLFFGSTIPVITPRVLSCNRCTQHVKYCIAIDFLTPPLTVDLFGWFEMEMPLPNDGTTLLQSQPAVCSQGGTLPLKASQIAWLWNSGL